MVTNQTAIIIVCICVLVGGYNLNKGNMGTVVASIVVGFLCGLSVYLHVLAGQPIW